MTRLGSKDQHVCKTCGVSLREEDGSLKRYWTYIESIVGGIPRSAFACTEHMTQVKLDQKARYESKFP